MSILSWFDNTQYMMILIIAGATPAEKLLQIYNEKWAQNVDLVLTLHSEIKENIKT